MKLQVKPSSDELQARSYQPVFESHKLVGGLSSAQARRKTVQDFKALNLEPAVNRLPGQLSGGMSQRVAFAAAVAGDGTLLLADEPTSRLAPITQKQTMSLLDEVARENRTSVVLVTHDAVMADRWVGETHSLA